MPERKSLSETLAGKRPNLSIFLTAGYPELNSALELVPALTKAGVDFIELGFPFSDPIADGPVIQEASSKALANGMTLAKLLEEQLPQIRSASNVPLLLMGYLNPVLQYGMKKFLERAAAGGADGFIIPDLPIQVYRDEIAPLLKPGWPRPVFLMTTRSTEERIRELDELDPAFLYLVAAAGTTGLTLSPSQLEPEFKRISEIEFKTPVVVGFGISDRPSYMLATKYFSGAIVGTAFLRSLGTRSEPLDRHLTKFLEGIRL